MKNIYVFMRKIFRQAVSYAWLPVILMKALWIHAFGGSYWEKVLKISYCSSDWARGLAWIMGLERRVYGDPAEANGALIVSNHCGYLDVMAEACTFPIRFAPNSGIRKWPFLGWYLGLSMPVWVDRNSRQQSFEVMKAFRETLHHGVNMLIYPEGTSTDGKHGLLPFKSTAFEAVCGGNIPILPVVLNYHPTPDGFPLAWFGDATLIPHYWHILGYRRQIVELHILPKIYPGDRNRKELAQYVHDIMQTKYNEIKSKIEHKENSNG